MTDGEEKLRELRRFVDSSIFDSWEQGFIRGLGRRRYDKLTKHEKAVVNRLYGWLQGNEPDHAE